MDSFTVRAIREEEREECLNLWCAVWPGEGSPAYFRRYFYGDVEWLPYYTQVGVVDGKIVSAVQICKRTVACGDFQLTMGGIANVATLPEYRGQGFNTECLRRAIAVMEADAMDFSLLFTGIPDYYARQGFNTVERSWLAGNIRQGFKPTDTGLKVRRAIAADLPTIQQIYTAYNRQRPIAVQRTAAYWRDWMNIAPPHIPESLLVVTDAESEVVGYLNSGVFKSAIPYSADAAGTRIIELGIRGGVSADQEEAAVTALLENVASTIRAQGPEMLRLEIALTPAVMSAFKAIVAEPQEHFNASGMICLLHRDNLLRSLTMSLNERWLAAGRPHGALTFATPYGLVRLNANGAYLHVHTVDEQLQDEDILTQSALMGLLFGMMKPEQTTKDVQLYPLITALFPPQASIYYGADGF